MGDEEAEEDGSSSSFDDDGETDEQNTDSLSSSSDESTYQAMEHARVERSSRRRAMMRNLNPLQLTLYERYQEGFRRFLFQISETKDPRDEATLNGVYINQYKTLAPYLASFTFDERSDIETIYEVNHGHPMPEYLRDHIVKLTSDIRSGVVEVDGPWLTDDSDDADATDDIFER